MTKPMKVLHERKENILCRSWDGNSEECCWLSPGLESFCVGFQVQMYYFVVQSICKLHYILTPTHIFSMCVTFSMHFTLWCFPFFPYIHRRQVDTTMETYNTAVATKLGLTSAFARHEIYWRHWTEFRYKCKALAIYVEALLDSITYRFYVQLLPKSNAYYTYWMSFLLDWVSGSLKQKC